MFHLFCLFGRKKTVRMESIYWKRGSYFMKGAKIPRKYLDGGDLSAVFAAIGGEQENFNWLISDHDFLTRDETLRRQFSWTGVFLTGEELTALFCPGGRISLISAVLSAFPKEVTPFEIQKYDLPGWESKIYWQDDLALQNPLAQMELVLYDGWQLLFLSRRDRPVEDLLRTFPRAEDLAFSNRRSNEMERRIEESLRRAAAERGIPLTETVENRKYDVYRSLCLNQDGSEHFDVADWEIERAIFGVLQKKG